MKKFALKTVKFRNFFLTFILVVVTIFPTNAHKIGPTYVYECPECSNLLIRGSSGSSYFVCNYGSVWVTFAVDMEKKEIDEHGIYR